MSKIDFKKLRNGTDKDVEKVAEGSGQQRENNGIKIGPDQLVSVVKVGEPKGMRADDSWMQVTLAIGIGKEKGQSVNETIFVPLQSIYYGSGKNPLFLFSKLVKFCAGLGVELTPKNAKDVLPDLFGNPDDLLGREFIADITYEDKPRIMKDRATNKFILVNPDGTKVAGVEGDNMDEVTGQAALKGIQTAFKRVTNLRPVKKVQQHEVEEVELEWDDDGI